MAVDLVSIYFPTYSELTPEQLQDMRTRLLNYMLQAQPDLDMRPDSVWGNLYLAPAADLSAALEVALGRVLSDLDLENTAQGTTYNCEFVEAFLKNFAVVNSATLQSAGVVRFLFSADGTYFIDRRALYQFGNDTFTLRLANEGGLTVNPVGTPLTSVTNNATLTQISQTLYAFDWPVSGTMTTPVTAGALATTNYPLDNLTSVSAIADFSQGTPTLSLADMAKKARQTFYSASLNNRGCARRFLKQEFPDVTAASPVLSGDFEQMRGSVNPLGFYTGDLDALVKSSGYNTQDELTVRLKYEAIQSGNPIKMFIGEVRFTSYPLKLDEIYYSENRLINLNPSGTDIKIFSQSTSFTRAPMATCGYSNLERIWICIPMPRDPSSGGDLITPGVLPDGTQYADFTIPYRIDPLLPGISAYVGSPENAAAAVDTLVKSFVPIVIDALEIRYVRAPGTTVQVENARDQISRYMASLGGPMALYSDSRVYDIMYFAGAMDVRQIAARARVRWSVADYYIRYNGTLPTEDFTQALADAVPAKDITISSSAGFLPEYRDPKIGTADASFEAVGERNVAYILDPEDIVFTEIL